MSLDTFVKTWLGRRTNYDNVYAYQCVDLILQYIADVYGIKSGVMGNAIDYWDRPSSPLLSKFEKVSSKVPQKGDIVILNPTQYNPYGHIGIALSPTTILEQNGATGDGDGLGGDEVRVSDFTKFYTVRGILRLKKETYMLEKQRPVFRAEYYLKNNPDVAKAGYTTKTAVNHWLQFGIKEGRKSAPNFHVKEYMAIYADLRRAYGKTGYAKAVKHYFNYGINEGRFGTNKAKADHDKLVAGTPDSKLQSFKDAIRKIIGG